MKVLITGANGFVGKNLRSQLSLNKDIELLCYDRESSEEDLDRYTNLYNSGAVSKQVLDQAQAKYDSAKATLTSTEQAQH